MQRSEANPYVFLISGAIVMAFISGIKFLVGDDMGIIGLILTFAYGGLIGHLATTKHTSFLKNLAFFSFIFFVLWSLFTPFETVGGITVIKNVEFWTIALIAIIFLEREILNSIRRIAKKKERIFPAFIGGIAILILFNVTGINASISKLFSEYWYVAVGFMLVWFTILYFAIGTGLKKTGDRIVKILN